MANKQDGHGYSLTKSTVQRKACGLGVSGCCCAGCSSCAVLRVTSGTCSAYSKLVVSTMFHMIYYCSSVWLYQGCSFSDIHRLAQQEAVV